MRGRGLAGRCVDFACSHLREMGVGEVWLMVNSDNEPARRCYRRIGFEEIAGIHQVFVLGRRVSERIEPVSPDDPGG